MSRICSILALAFLPLLAACPPDDTESRQTLDQLPNLEDRYNQYEGVAVMTQIRNGGLLTAVLNGDPRLAAVAGMLSTYGMCAQEKGLVNWRLYTRRDDISAAGVVFIASQRYLNDPSVVFGCAFSFVQSEELSPCLHRYAYDWQKEGGAPGERDRYYVVLAGTKPSVCADFCKVMQGCQLTAVRTGPAAPSVVANRPQPERHRMRA